jgi:hypothetical protein
MYPTFDWSVALQAIMDISARASSLVDRPQLGPLGSPVFACANTTYHQGRAFAMAPRGSVYADASRDPYSPVDTTQHAIS